MLNIQLFKDQANKYRNYRNECQFQAAWKKRNENKVLQAFLLPLDNYTVLHFDQFCFIKNKEPSEKDSSILTFLTAHNFELIASGYNTISNGVAYYNKELNLVLDVVSVKEFECLREAITLAVGVAKAEDTKYLLSTVFETYMTQVFSTTKLRT
jgi:hypothetical protein